MMNENRIVLVAKDDRGDYCYGCVFDTGHCDVGGGEMFACTDDIRKDGRNIIWVIEPEPSRMTDVQKANVESKFSEVA